MNNKLWAGRFSKPTHPEVEAFTASISFDYQLAEEDILGSLAHASMLAHCGIITNDECQQLVEGLKQILKEIAENKIQFNISDEDIHMNIERHLHRLVGEVAGKLHTARSRNDQVALDIHLYLRKQVLIIIELLIKLQNTLLKLAADHNEIILPGYTHLQRAQPIALSTHWLAYLSMLQRDIERLRASWPHVNQSPLGACAVAGTTLPIDREYVATLLGFDSVYENTLDAVSDRDFVIHFLANASLIMVHLSRMSEELILWASQEFNFLSFDDAYSTGSSIMPQKKNPDVVELGRGKTGRVYGNLFSLLTVIKGLPLAYNKDLQEDKEPLFDTVKTISQTLSIYSALLENIKINKAAMYAAAENGYLNATALAEYLVKKNIPFRQAHEIVGKLVAFSLEKSIRLEDIPLPQFKQFSKSITEDVYQALSIEKAVLACASNRHLTKGGTSMSELSIHEQRVKSNLTWLHEKQQQLLKCYEAFKLD